MSQPIISVRDLSKVYRLGEIGVTSLREETTRKWRKFRGKEPQQDEGEFWALRDVSFDVHPGEVVGIVGKNGAGKSTLLKVISRITEPTHGEIRLRGRVAALLEVGTGFHPELTGRENIYLNGTILGMKKREIDRKLDEIIDFSGIEKHIDTPVKRYSSGMNVRLGFAVAAHLEPEILIVDEVLAVGDTEFQKKCLGKMKDVANHGRTILFVSHNLAAVESLCHRAILLSEGGVCDDRPSEEVIQNYLNRFKKSNRIPLRERTDREGARTTKITEVEIHSEQPHEGALRPDEPITISVSYESDTELAHPVCAVGIYNVKQIKVIHLTTQVKTLATKCFESRGRFLCTIESLPVNSGDYTLNLSLHDGDTLLDRIENASEFTILAGNTFGTGKTLPSAQGILLLDHEWQWQHDN